MGKWYSAKKRSSSKYDGDQGVVEGVGQQLVVGKMLQRWICTRISMRLLYVIKLPCVEDCVSHCCNSLNDMEIIIARAQAQAQAQAQVPAESLGNLPIN
jgi:hypothetical protein